MEQNNSAQEHLTVNPKDITESLNHVNSLLAQCLAILNSLGPTLSQTLHDDQHLPKMEEVHLAARATDTLHKIQLLLDPPALILADHFLGRHMLFSFLVLIWSILKPPQGMFGQNASQLRFSMVFRMPWRKAPWLSLILRSLLIQGVIGFVRY